MASPHEDWAFNTLLLNISNSMTVKDLNDAKSIVKGDGGIGEGVLEKINTPNELFDVLRRRTMLDRYNLLFLQAILYHIGRKDLLDLAVDYVHSRSDVIHFKSPPAEPGIKGTETLETNEQDHTKCVYDQLKECQRRLEASEVECINLKRRLMGSSEYSSKNQFRITQIRLVRHEYLEQRISNLSVQSAIDLFRLAMLHSFRYAFFSYVYHAHAF